MDFEQTIVAVSTAPGIGAIAVVRISGERSLEIIKSIFRTAKDNNDEVDFKSHQAKHGFIYDLEKNETIDEVMVTAFLAPHSYTGENTVEISCHGSPLLTRRIVTACLKAGARLAHPGEFTRRAFLAGKIDLAQAEAVLDLIQAKTARGSQAALSVLKGDLGKELNAVRDDLKRLLTSVVASIDFPDEVGDLENQDIEDVVNGNMRKLKGLAETARSGKYLRDGLKLAIVGRPNAGKSSLLNCLLKVERAIVTDIPGTTRDSLEEQLDINGIPITLVDTAGMRHTDDHLEKLGIERTRQVLADSQLVLLIADQTCGWQNEEQEILNTIKGKPCILLWNKMDLPVDKDNVSSNHAQDFIANIKISAKTGEGIEQLADYIEKWVFADKKAQEAGPSLNARQAALCEQAIGELQLVKKTLENSMPHDCLATDLKGCLNYLSEIAGEAVSDEIIGSVFANFCIGK